ncbi:Sulfide dehydrogenase [flavocytochrome c] flavoprotein chain precursor [Metalysinibacillus saudimassiliensis]|uniref:Sulfide dehydrogenase [flavocytochrome c] flavoprotein chain n=1 Tax=Metalysinibacillus saudimassiliensis TaxID=1461583 RepID=A0A078ME98_9BACL|nr:Sulfide dehydrogenase [flavocytochrome c] flavoprotein chain precursor [Metalysinibacillus saudimassiliensis]
MTEMKKTIAIVGAGTAGVTMAAQLLRKASYLKNNIVIIDPSDKHYYQPFFTLVGGGDSKLEDNVRPQAEVVPEGALLLQEAVTTFKPDTNEIETNKGTVITYDYLMVAAGIQLDWDKVKGLKETMGKNGVCSNYHQDYVESTWEAMKAVNGGRAIFTQPSTPVKCAGAPQKIMYLADEHFRRVGVRDKTKVEFISGMDDLFPVKRYYPILKKLVADKGIGETYFMDLVEVNGAARKATFKNSKTGETITREFDMLHVTPPMSAPDFIKKSPIANEAGWVDLDMHTLRHTKYENIFGAGDCTSLPTSRTGAAIRKQAPVAVDNLLAHMNKKEMTASYDGYSSCPVVTGYSTVMLAEFVYGYEAQESFPIDQRKQRHSMHMLKKNVLPMMYWNGMLKGTM